MFNKFLYQLQKTINDHLISVFTFFMSFGTAVILLVGNEETIYFFTSIVLHNIFRISTGLSVYISFYISKREKGRINYDLILKNPKL